MMETLEAKHKAKYEEKHEEKHDDEKTTVEPQIEMEELKPILYKINEQLPIYLSTFFGIQQGLLSITGSIVLPLLVAEAVCAIDNGDIVRKLVSSTFLLSGLCTLGQCLLGIRLPIYQGPTSTYIIPIIALSTIDPTRCDLTHVMPAGYNMTTIANSTTSIESLQEDLIMLRLRQLMWPLIIAGTIHGLIGATGMIGLLLRFIGPVTIVPTILLIGLYITKPSQRFVEPHWGIAALTWMMGVILSLYLVRRQMPLPAWSRGKGFHIIRYPLHQVFAILISILIGWAVCGVMTLAGAFPTDKNDLMYKARTDYRLDVIRDSPWFYLPHPVQFGNPMFDVSAVVGFLMATTVSILDSVGDYYATAAVCRVPTPPSHAVNRGIAVEGFFSMLSGWFGIGHATTTYGGNIGAIGMTRVASRRVFICTGLFYVTIGCLAKVSAIVVSIPYPVLGGVILTTIGVFVGVNLSNLKVVDLASTRNLSIMGMSIFIGFLVPQWAEKNSDAVNTGNDVLDRILVMILGNPNFIGALIACTLDNTIPGTREERGLTAWEKNENENLDDYIEGNEVYDIPLPACLKRRKLIKYIPWLPKYDEAKKKNGYNVNGGFDANDI